MLIDWQRYQFWGGGPLPSDWAPTDNKSMAGGDSRFAQLGCLYIITCIMCTVSRRGEGVAPMRCEVRDRNVDRKGREENKELLSADIPVHPNNYSMLSAAPATPQVGSR